MSFACHVCDDRWTNTPHPNGNGVWVLDCPMCDLHLRSMPPIALQAALELDRSHALSLAAARQIEGGVWPGPEAQFVCAEWFHRSERGALRIRPVPIEEPPRPDDFWNGADLASYLGIHSPFENAVPRGVQFPVGVAA